MSLSDAERGLIARYAARVLKRSDVPLRSLRQLVFWLNDRTESMSFPLPAPVSKAIGQLYSSNFKAGEFEKALVSSREKIIAMLEKAADETPLPEPLQGNIALLTAALGLEPEAIPFVLLVACYTRYDQFQYFVQNVLEASGPSPKALSILLDIPQRSAEDLTTPSGALAATGLVQHSEGNELAGLAGRFNIPFRVNACLDRSYDGFAGLRNAMLGLPVKSENDLGDYEHLIADRDLIAAVIKGAAKTAAKGVNILLYGPPGTGKTELSKVVAAAAGVSLYSAGEETATGSEADRSARLADLVFSLQLLAGSPKTALLFDEMEDIAWQLVKRGGSKVFLNRLLETNPVPIFWTSNNIHEIDPALLRRMTLAVEMRLPPPSQRRRIMKRLAERGGLKLSDKETDQLSRKLAATPAVLENAIRAAKLAGGGVDQVERAALGIIRAVSGAPPKRPTAFPEFVPELVSANIDLIELANQLVRGGNLAFSLCLSGPPGTGKSAYARYLARRLGLEVMQKRASDLLGAYVGESEKRIAEAFEDARDAGAFLVFDEADSLLFDRTQAVRSWEVTQVNEMLTWMEDHLFPVCFTTNLMDRMDQASLRRFTFHVRFDYLDRKAIQRAFTLFFGIKQTPPSAFELGNLTPGDFAQAKKQAAVLGVGADARRVVELLTDLSRAKRETGSVIGFVT